MFRPCMLRCVNQPCPALFGTNRTTRRHGPLALIVATVLLSLAGVAAAGDGETARPSPLDLIQVTATRFADQVQEVPNSIDVVTGEELRARGVRDLRGALAQMGGVTVGPGGEDGTAGSSLGLLGRTETDDFLLVIDGVPAGGAFTPQFATLNLHNVERIELIRGTAPVYYGTTAFAGTLNVIHYAAGKGPTQVSVSAGSFGTAEVAAAGAIDAGALRQNLSADATREAFADTRSGFHRVHGLYRAAMDLGGGEARLDLDLTDLRDRPASPTPYAGTTALLAPDFNQNPLNGRIDAHVGKLTAAYDHPWGTAVWSSLVSLTHTHTRSVRGFLDTGYASETGTNATGFEQDRTITDVFVDSHVNLALGPAVNLTTGLNVLEGTLDINSRQFAYLVPFDGSAPAASSAWDTLDNTRLGDHRSFLGAYAQSRWKISRDLSLLAGARWNLTRETRDGYGDQEGWDHETARSSRLSGSLGANWWLWHDASGDLDDLSVYVNLGNTFQPPQVDFGPDAQSGPILKPEFLQSGEIGVKADGLDGRLDMGLSAFGVHFNNRPLNATINNQPSIVAGGQQRFAGFEAEIGVRLDPDVKLRVEYARNNASYGNFPTQLDGSGALVQLQGNRLEFVPRQVVGLGVLFEPAAGWRAGVNAQYQGARYLDPQNLTQAPGFVMVDAVGGYRWSRWDLSLSAQNLGDRREPVLTSELGSGQIYRSNGRRAFATLAFRFE